MGGDHGIKDWLSDIKIIGPLHACYICLGKLRDIRPQLRVDCRSISTYIVDLWISTKNVPHRQLFWAIKTHAFSNPALSLIASGPCMVLATSVAIEKRR